MPRSRRNLVAGLAGGSLKRMALRRLAMHVPDWWEDANDDLDEGCDDWYTCYWYYLCAVYAVVGIAALVHLTRIHLRVPDYGWTPQKVFNLLNVLVCLLRALTFGLHSYLDDLEDAVGTYTVQFFIFDLASLLFFTAYTVLVLHWAQVYHDVVNAEPHNLINYFVGINFLVYFIQAVLWFLTIPDDTEDEARYISAGWLTFVFVGAMLGFVVYGGRLFLIMMRFPIESRSRKKKLHELGIITLICSVCFVARAAFMFMYILDEDDFDLDLMEDDLLNIIFYALCEIFPATCVLIIRRQLPPKRIKSAVSDGYSPLDEPPSG